MAEQTVSITFRISFAWWALLYMRSVCAFAALHGLQADAGKVERMLRRGMRVTMVSGCAKAHIHGEKQP